MTDLSSLTNFISTLLSLSAACHHVPLSTFKKSVKILATGGGAHMYGDLLKEELGLEVGRYAEMECLIEGLAFVMQVEGEVFWYSDELVRDLTHNPAHPSSSKSPPISPTTANSSRSQQPLPMERPSPDPPRYSILFDPDPKPQFPCLLVNIGSGVSILRVDDYDKFERVSGTSLGGGTLWGLLSLLTGAGSFDEMLALSERGDNSTVDMLVGDIYGSNQDLAKMGLKSSTIASSFGKVFKKGQRKREWKPEDISKSLLYAISNNIGQIAYMNAEAQNVDKIFFSGCFIRGHAATMATLSYAIRFWSKGTKRALFLRHEGYLGALGAWMKNMEKELTT
ncbi:fumble [Atractiella rhizophila]|nr:fumble [Atractiella rhizophila]